ncbi:MAG: DsrE family protein [Pseudomonadota bacterium]
MFRIIAAALTLPYLVLTAANAQPESFGPGPLIPEFGVIADVEGREALPDNAAFKVAYDVTAGAEPGEVSRSLTTGARFLNMHAAAGVKPENMQLAFVLHGSSVFDVVRDARYQAQHGEDNATAALVEELLKHNVQIFVCGQSAAYQDVATDDLLPGVKMSLSAMTAHALLQQEGYTLNPF